MNILSTITGLFKSGPDAATKVLDAGIKGIDALVFTEEEKAEKHSKLADQWIELQKILGEETTSRGVTRRILAVLFSGGYLLVALGAAIAWPFNKEYADFLWEVSNGQLGWVSLTVAAFYFGPHFIAQMLEKMKGK